MEFVIDAADRHRSAGHEAIRFIGNLNEKWSLSAHTAIIRIEAKAARFFVHDKLSGERVEIRVVRKDGQKPYLQTYAYGRWTDHLLGLPRTRDCMLID